MIDAPLAYAFGVGMVATFNPCGFAMLPAYLSYFLGLETAVDEDQRSSVFRALGVGLVMTAGFLVVFGLLGIVLEPLLAEVMDKLPWVTAILGVVLVGLGIAMLFGRTITISVPKVGRGPTGREYWSVFVFGISYALVSMSCSILPFLGVMARVASSYSASGIAAFLAYGLGMGLVIMVLTLAIALARKGLVQSLRRVLPYVNRICGGLLLIAGAYVAYYGWYELAQRSGTADPGGPAGWVFDLQSDIARWIQEVGPVRIGLILALVIALAVTVTLALQGREPRSSAE